MSEYLKKYTPSEADILKQKILSLKFSHVITDPYPEHTAYELMDRLSQYRRKPRDVSIHEAWMEGFKFAWSLIEKELLK